MSARFCHVSEGQAFPTAEMRAASGGVFRQRLTGFLILTLTAAFTPDAAAETLSWTGSGGEDWSDGANWSPSARPPGAGDDAVIDSAGPVVATGTNAQASQVVIGNGPGSGTLVIDGGLQTNSLVLGAATGSSGTATFSGAQWSNSGAVLIGGNGTGALLLSHGTTGDGVKIEVGGGSSVTLDNSSSLKSSDTVSVGYGGGPPSAAASLGVNAASRLESQRGVVGEAASSAGNAGVSGQDSLWAVSRDMVVGEAGVGTLTITGGGKVISQMATVIADLATADGSAVTVSRLGSSLESGGALIVGNEGSGSLRVEAAGSVTSAGAVIGRHSTGEATVTGEASRWTTGDMQVGGGADGAAPAGNGRLNILAGGAVASNAATLGAGAGASGSALVDGQGSAWTVGSADLKVGADGSGSLSVTGGGLVDAEKISLGANAGGSGSARITGAGSMVQSRADLAVGGSGNGSLSVESGGAVKSRDGYVAAQNGSSSTVTVTGGGSSWTMTGAFFVGHEAGTNADVTVSAGGSIGAARLALGNLAGSSGTVTITGSDSSVTAYVISGTAGSGSVQVGVEGAGNLTVTNGAALGAYDLYAGSATGSNGRVSISGAGSRVTLDNRLVIGNGGNGAVEVTGGGSLASPAILIAATAGSTGVLNIGAAAGQTARSAGAVEARTMTFGAGDGRIVFNHSEDGYVLSADISGAGSVLAANGVTTLAGNNSYSGGTTISGGTLKGTARSFGSGDIANDAQLVVDGSGTLANAISGTGSFEKTGGGTLSLNGSSTYTGITTVSSGRLNIDGSLASAVLVSDGATAGGSGTIGGLAVASGGTLAPGNPVGTLTSTGSATFAGGSTYAVDIDAAGNADRLAVTGTITIDNDVRLVVTPVTNHSAFSLGARYTILTATGGITGTFSRVEENFVYLTARLTQSVGSDASYLSFVRTSADAGLFAGATSTANARAAANAVEALGENAALYQTAAFLQAGETQSAFSQLAGEIHPSLAMALIDRSGQTRDVILGRLRSALPQVDAGTTAFDPGDGSLTFWSSGFGSRASIDGDGNGAAVDMKGGGILFGLEGDVGTSWRAGVAGGYGRDEVREPLLAASADVGSYDLAAYVGTEIGPASLRLGAIHTIQTVETRRAVAFSTLKDELRADYDASTSQVFAEAAWRFDLDSARLEPYASIAYVNSRTDGFRERGGISAVSVGSARYDQFYTTLGARISGDIAFAAATASAVLDVGWRHGYGDRTFDSALFYDGGSAFSVASTATARDALLLNLGLRYDLNPATALTFRYGAVFGAGVLEQSAFAELGVRF